MRERAQGGSTQIIVVRLHVQISIINQSEGVKAAFQKHSCDLSADFVICSFKDGPTGTPFGSWASSWAEFLLTGFLCCIR